ncbi:MAG: cadherin-like beta sandwich domain-containing protein [Spirochaetia bacterium]|nr:cadherin-like beta sandwich domain-containing protein [Spirochaetia bacterium]
MYLKKLLSLALAASLGFGCVFNPEKDEKHDKNEEELLNEEDMAFLQSILMVTAFSGGTGTVQTVSAKLANLIVEGAVLNQVFNPDQISYQANCALTTPSVKVTAIPQNYSHQIKINGYLIAPGSTLTVPLNSNEEVITISVTDPGTGSSSTYVVIVKRA